MFSVHKKRMLALLLAAALAAGCAGCSLGKKEKEGAPAAVSSSGSAAASLEEEPAKPEEGSPAAAATEVMENFKKVRMDQLQEAITDESMKAMAGEAEGLMKSLVKNMSYELGEAQVSGDTAVVPVTITNNDYSGTINELLPALVGIALEHPDASQQEMGGLILEKLAGLVEQSAGAPVSAEAEIRLVQKDGEWTAQDWQQQDSARLLDAVSGGLFGAFLDMADQLGQLAG